MNIELTHVPFKEIVERIKDIISKDIDGKVFDHHVADILWLDYSSVRVYKTTNYLPLQNVIIFCQQRKISVDWMLFSHLGFDDFTKSVN